MSSRGTRGGAPERGLHRLALAVVVGAVALVASAPPSAVAASGTNIVAQVRGRSIPVYRYPGASRPFVRFGGGNGAGQRRVFLVAQRLPGWVRVYVPLRPNGTTGWVRARGVSLARDPFRVVVSRRTHTLTVLRNERRVLRTRVAVGRRRLPTPRGLFYLVELLKQPNPRGLYGPYAFGLSAYSNVLYHFGAGPGRIGLHGTDYPAGLGHSISHGCIRVSNTVVARLARLLPLGTPVLVRN